MRLLIVLLVMIIALSVESILSDASISTSSYLTAFDKTRLAKVVEPGFKLDNEATAYYAVVGYKLLGLNVPNTKEICKYLKTVSNNNDVSAERLFYIVSISKDIGGCQELPTVKLIKALVNTIEKDSLTLPELYFSMNALNALSHKLPDDKISKVTETVQTTLRKDDSLMNLGYALNIASQLGQVGAFAFERIEDAIIQADEVDGQYLQFEGGLSVTSLLVNGIFKLSSSLKKKPPVTYQQTVKLANYLLSRRSVQTPKGVVSLLSSLTTVGTNEFEKPICITLTDGRNIVSQEQPLVSIRVCDILGNPLPSVPKVIANAAIRVGDDVVVLSEESFQPSSTDKTLFKLNFMKIKPDRGFYKLAISADSITNSVTVKVLSAVIVDYLEVGTGDADQTTQPKLTRVVFPEKLNEKVEADSQQKLVMRFLLRDASNRKPIRVHQAFVRLSSVSESNKEGREIIFVAEPDASNVYKFDMHLGSAAANFDHRSGNYDVQLIVGDTVLSNPFQWTVATASLKFPEAAVAESVDKSTSYKQKPNVYTTKPEIKHMFREPEKRPPAFVSNLFTGLCLAPIILLFVIWFKLGVNISNFPLSLYAVMFHIGLGSIFVLFGIFWLKLNMFVTLRYLLGLGVVTFLAGNKLLSRTAQRHKSSAR